MSNESGLVTAQQALLRREPKHANACNGFERCDLIVNLAAFLPVSELGDFASAGAGLNGPLS